MWYFSTVSNYHVHHKSNVAPKLLEASWSFYLNPKYVKLTKVSKVSKLRAID